MLQSNDMSSVFDKAKEPLCVERDNGDNVFHLPSICCFDCQLYEGLSFELYNLNGKIRGRMTKTLLNHEIEKVKKEIKSKEYVIKRDSDFIDSLKAEMEDLGSSNQDKEKLPRSSNHNRRKNCRRTRTKASPWYSKLLQFLQKEIEELTASKKTTQLKNNAKKLLAEKTKLKHLIFSNTVYNACVMSEKGALEQKLRNLEMKHRALDCYSLTIKQSSFRGDSASIQFELSLHDYTVSLHYPRISSEFCTEDTYICYADDFPWSLRFVDN